MSRLAPDLQSSDNALIAGAAFDCRATAALLKAMDPLIWGAHVAAVLAVVYHAWLPLLPWGLVIYFAIRVRLDAALLEILACDPGSAPSHLDGWLSRVGLRKYPGKRSIEDRCRGARRLVAISSPRV